MRTESTPRGVTKERPGASIEELATTVVDARRRVRLKLEARNGSQRRRPWLTTGRPDRLLASRRETLYRLALAAEFRDHQMIGHLSRVGQYTGLLARANGIDTARCEAIHIASCLHDVGKIGIPDRILQKPGPLTAAERLTIERHTLIGHALLAESGDELLDLAATIALTHHEHVDGTGYPRSLTGNDIPIEGRMVALTDAFDALTSDRAYRPSRSLAEAISVLRRGRDRNFDGHLLDQFLLILPEVRAVLEGGAAAQLPLEALLDLDAESMDDANHAA